MIRLHPAEEHGRLKTADGQVIDFHGNAVAGGDDPPVGDREHFAAELGDQGPQATSVHPD